MLPQLLWKTVWWFLKMLNIGLPYDLAIPFIGVCLTEMKTRSDKNWYTDVHSSIHVPGSQRVEATLMSVN